MAAQKFAVTKNLGDRSVGNNSPLIEDDGSVTQFERIWQVVGDHEHRQREATKDVSELATTGGIKIGRRLVEDQHVGMHRENCCDSDPTLLAVREVMRSAIDRVKHVNVEQCFRHARIEFFAAESQVRRTERDVVTHARCEELIVWVLKDHANSTPHFGQSARGDLEPVNDNASRSRASSAASEDSVEMECERCLAGTVGAEKGYPFSAFDRERYVVKHLRAVWVGGG